ncbi:hypothetical protein JYT83_00855 [bacterium AH-315-F18]|nr:hypothetical protein [bacterium AH-315-F18]
MINFRDFSPKGRVETSFLSHEIIVESLKVPLDRANNWIAMDDIDVINVETVVLPNIYSDQESGTMDTNLRTSGEVSSYWHQFVRVWYRRNPTVD